MITIQMDVATSAHYNELFKFLDLDIWLPMFVTLFCDEVIVSMTSEVFPILMAHSK